MKISVQIPIKAKSSTRVENKNFRDLSGKSLCFWLLDEVAEKCPSDWELYIDSEKESTFSDISKRYSDRFNFHLRESWFAGDQANGNHLINQFALAHPDAEIIVQLYVTAVTLPGEVIVEAVEELVRNIHSRDSVLLVSEETGWFWAGNEAVNYVPDRPNGLPRSQDATLLKETTGMYAATREVILRNGCRIGEKPIFFRVPQKYALDIDTMEDFEAAQAILSHDQRIPS